MSMRQVLATVLGAMQDAGVGLAAQVEVLNAETLLAVRSEFTFGKWGFGSALADARTHRVTVRPAAGEDDTKMQEQLQRDGVQELELALETFGTQPDAIQDTIAVVQAAMLMVLDHLIEYSDATGGTIIEVIDPVRTTYGEFEGGVSGTNAGFVSRVTIRERSPAPTS